MSKTIWQKVAEAEANAARQRAHVRKMRRKGFALVREYIHKEDRERVIRYLKMVRNSREAAK